MMRKGPSRPQEGNAAVTKSVVDDADTFRAVGGSMRLRIGMSWVQDCLRYR